MLESPTGSHFLLFLLFFFHKSICSYNGFFVFVSFSHSCLHFSHWFAVLLSGSVLGFEIISIDIVDGVYRNWENPEHNLQWFAVAC